MKRGAMHRMRAMQELPHVRNHMKQQMKPREAGSSNMTTPPSRSGAAFPPPAQPNDDTEPSPVQTPRSSEVVPKPSHFTPSDNSVAPPQSTSLAPHVFRRIAVDQVSLRARGLSQQNAVGIRGTWLLTSPSPVGDHYIVFHVDPLTGAMQEYIVSADQRIFDRHTVSVLDTLETDEFVQE